MDHDAGVIARPQYRMWPRPDGIVHLVWAPRAEIALEDALAATRLTDSQALLGRRMRGPHDSARLQTRDDEPTGRASGIDQLLGRETRPGAEVGEMAFHGARPNAHELGGVVD